MKLYEDEINVLKLCRNHNIVNFIVEIITHNNRYVVMEYCPDGDMEQYLNNVKKINEDEAKDILKQLVNGMKHLHQNSVMHRDFKLANILRNGKEVKIADLGFAKVMGLQSEAETVLGTKQTMAPEVLNEDLYSYKADVWSLGIVYY